MQRDPQHFGGMKVPRLADESDDWRLRLNEGLHSWIVFGLHTTTSGHTEGADLGLAQVQFSNAIKEGHILFVGQGVSPFDHIDPDLRQSLGDVQFVLQGKADPFALGSVAKGRIVDENRSHGIRAKGWKQKTPEVLLQGLCWSQSTSRNSAIIP